MKSIIMYDTLTKLIKFSFPNRDSVDVYITACNMVGLDAADYTGIAVDGKFNTTKAKEYLYVTELDVVEHKQAMSISVDMFSITADGADKATISGCPEGAEAYQDQELLGVVPADGLVEITSAVPKEMKIKIILHPWLDWEGVINAT